MYSPVVLRSDIDHLVVKHNKLIESKGYLSESENKLVLLAIVLTRLYAKDETRDLKIDAKIRLYAKDYMMIYGVNRNTAYSSMNEALDSLYDRSFTIKEDGIDVTYHWLLSKGSKEQTNVADGYIEFAFSPKAIELITDFEHGSFTSYGIERVTRLNGRYAGRIYELCMENKNKPVKQTRIFSMDELRDILGIEQTEYRDKRKFVEGMNILDLPNRIDNFKTKVIAPALKIINTESDITLEVHNHKTGKAITGLYFSFDFKADYKPKFLLEENIDQDDSKEMRTVGDETKKPAKAPTVKPKLPTVKNEKDHLGTDLRPEDLVSKANPAQKYIVNSCMKQTKADPNMPNDKTYDLYVKAGGTLTKDEIRSKSMSNQQSAAAFLLQQMMELKNK